MTTKKYTLFKPQEGTIQPCAFFLSPQGCKNGDKCKFAHVLQNPTTPATTAGNKPKDEQHSISSSDISSESEDENPPVNYTNQIPKNATTSIPAVSDPYDDPFLYPGVNPAFSDSHKKRKRNDGNDTTPNISNTPEDQTNSVPEVSAAMKEKGTKKAKVVKKLDSFGDLDPPKVQKNTVPAVSAATKEKEPKKAKIVEKQTSFRDLDLPIASFSIPEVSSGRLTLPTYASLAKQAVKPTPKIPIPTSTPEGLKWQNAVISTRNNPRYSSDFDFDRLKGQQQEKGIKNKWIKARPYGDWCKGNPHAIAIDCEMCETKCPISGASNHKALCRLSIVNAVNPDEVLIDTLVKPDWPVVDHRSRINGINKDHLKEVAFTLDHAQKFMMALCSEETVIIGHAVHNDLTALHMEHHCNADSAFLFQVKDEPNATPSLKDLAMGICNREMPDTHDSVNDARAALLCLEEGYIKTNGNPEPVSRSFLKKNPNAELLVHRIPLNLKQEHIERMFLTYTSVQTTKIGEIEFGKDSGKTIVTFASADHANLAFDAIQGEEKADKGGRMQKRIYLKTGGYVQIRRMLPPKKN